MPPAADLRILVLSNAVPQTWFAGSLLLYRLLQQHPAGRLKAVGPAPQPASEILSCTYSTLLPAASGRLDLTRFAELKRSIQTVTPIGRIPDARVDAAVGDFDGDVVISVMERLDYVDAAHRFCARRRLPLALIVHDRLESFERVYAPFAESQRARIGEIYRSAAVRFCISPEMARHFAEAYGADGTVLYPNRADDLTPRAVEDSAVLKAGTRLTIGYAGALNYGYGERLAQLMPLLAESGVTLRVYSREAPPPMPGVEYAGSFRHTLDLWNQLKRECDVVWLPYSHTPDQRALYETHFPSKLTEYLALGMPVLITGPSYATGVQWGLRHPEGALTVADETGEQVRDAVMRLQADAGLRRRLASGATSAGDADFDPQRIRSIFFEALRQAAH